MHPDGYIELRDRAKDIIISGGENVSSIEVERVLMRHPDVVDVAVVAQPDPKWGERPRAFVALKPGSELAEHELIAFARRFLPGFKTPQNVESAPCHGTPPARSARPNCAIGHARASPRPRAPSGRIRITLIPCPVAVQRRSSVGRPLRRGGPGRARLAAFGVLVAGDVAHAVARRGAGAEIEHRAEKAHGPRRGPYRRANDRKLRQKAEATGLPATSEHACKSA